MVYLTEQSPSSHLHNVIAPVPCAFGMYAVVGSLLILLAERKV